MVRREAPRMKRGRAPCCDKTKVKRGPWSPAEDWKLTDFISKYGHENWRSLPKLAGLSRCGKSCRLRWINYLRPDVKRGHFTREEEDTIINLHRSLGNKWSQIASKLPGRTDNEIKNVWNTYLKKRLFPVGDADRKRGKSKVSPASSDSSSSSSTIVSDGEGITGKEIGPQEDHRGSLTKKPGITENAQELPGPEVCHTQEPTMEPKKMSSPFVSINNNFNDVTNSIQANVSEPQEQMAVVQGAINDDHQDMVDLLYEQDCDFWKVLDSISFQPEDMQLENADQGCQSSNFVNARFREVENGNWLQYLETELGLEPSDGKDGNLQGNLTGTDGLLQPLAPDSFHYQNPVQPEMGYGHLWL